MRERLLRDDRIELALRAAGVGLAAISAIFAVIMSAPSDREPEISGLEHLAIYARPAEVEQHGRRSQVDYTPIGSTRSAYPTTRLSGYEILEASRDNALLRLPEGRIARITPGANLPAVGAVVSIQQRGGKWLVVTRSGLIRQR